MMNFDDFCNKFGIKEETRKILAHEDLSNIDDLLEVSSKELESLSISLGQRKAVMRGLKALNSGETACTTSSYVAAKISNIDPRDITTNIASLGIVEEKTHKVPIQTEELNKLFRKCKIDEATMTVLKESGITTVTELVQKAHLDEVMSKISSKQREPLDKAIRKGKRIITGDGEKERNWFSRKMQDVQWLLPQQLKSYSEKMFGKKKLLTVTVKSEVERSGNLEVHPCPLDEEWRDDERKIRKLVSGTVIDSRKNKTVILVGASGSGKSTLIDGIANYVFNVQFEQRYRLRLINMTKEEKLNSSKGQTTSQTEWITVYTIPPAEETNTDFTLTIVDTPGFADTRGVERDEQLVEQLRHFFNNPKEHGVVMVNGICFVAKASDVRLTAQQRYIFDEILSMFGKDVKEHIFVMATFADGTVPPLISSLKEAKVPYKMLFPFNNSALFSPTERLSAETQQQNFTKMFWNLGMQSYRSFFKELKEIQPQSLVLTAEVLVQREQLENTLELLEQHIKLGCHKLKRLEKEQSVMERHQADIDENKDFSFTVDEEYIDQVKVPKGKFTTNCSICQQTCHPKCKISDDLKKADCWAMYKSGTQKGYCKICPSHCYWDKHFNLGYITEIKTKKVTKTYSTMKERYTQAKSKVKYSEQIQANLQKEVESCERDVKENMNIAKKCLEKLNEIALKPNPLSDVQYITLLIRDEERNMTDGWEDRVDVLERLKNTASLALFVASADSNKDKTESWLKTWVDA